MLPGGKPRVKPETKKTCHELMTRIICGAVLRKTFLEKRFHHKPAAEG